MTAFYLATLKYSNCRAPETAHWNGNCVSCINMHVSLMSFNECAKVIAIDLSIFYCKGFERIVFK